MCRMVAKCSGTGRLQANGGSVSSAGLANQPGIWKGKHG